MSKQSLVKFRSILAACLTIGHVVAVPLFPASARVSAAIGARDTTVNELISPSQLDNAPSVTVDSNAADLEKAFDLALRIMQHKELYRFLNETFATNVIAINNRATGLSLSQLVYLLQNTQKTWPQIEASLSEPPATSTGLIAQRAMRAKFLIHFDSIFSNAKLMSNLRKHNAANQPLRLVPRGGSSGYSDLRIHVNHPQLANPDDPKSAVLPSEDLRKIVIDFIKGAKHEVMYNVFDFDLMPVANALIERHQAGVKVIGGIDKGTAETRNEVKAVIDELKKHEAEGLETVLVDSVGLNHQKIIVRDAGTPNAAILFLSGNFTQSCIGPEGDLVDVPSAKRPPQSVPNANHAIFLKGAIPAAVAKQELKKTLVLGIRGQSNYPVGGAYQIMGPRKRAENNWIVMTFSPNGGLGDINRDVLSRVLRDTTGRIEALHFAFSSDILKDEIISRIAREAEARKRDRVPVSGLFASVGDTPFAMRDWSAFLALSGMAMDPSTKVYSEVADFPLKKVFNANEWMEYRNSIRTAPEIYGDRHVRIDGKSYHVTGKIHHKVFIFPENHVAVLGTSFNPSANAEQNNEQIMIIRDPLIMARARGMFAYLYFKSRSSVAFEAQRRNSLPPRPSDGEDGVEADLRAAGQ